MDKGERGVPRSHTGRASIQSEHKKVTPLQRLLIFQQRVKIFVWNFTQLLLNHMYTLSLSLVEMYWEVRKLCYFNQDNPPPHFSAFWALSFTSSGWWLWRESVCWWWNEDADIVIANAWSKNHQQSQPCRQAGTW